MSKPIDIKIYEGSVAPTVTATPDATGVIITITDVDGVHTAHINNGAPGATGATGPQGPIGPQGETGAPFAVTWIANSYEELKNDTTHCTVGQFAVISSTVEDPHNAELYVRTSILTPHGYWNYVTDMSGARGIQGPAGPSGPQGAQGAQGARGVSIDNIGLMNDGRLFIHFDGPIQGGQDYKYVTPTYLPPVTEEDNGKVLTVINGVWTKALI